MPSPSTISPGDRPRSVRPQFQYFGLIPAAIVVAGLYFGRPVLLPLAVASLFAFALAPLVAWLRHIGMGRISSVLLSALVSIGIIVAAGLFVGNQLIQLTDQLPQYQTNLEKKIESVRGSAMGDGIISRASTMLKSLRDQVSDASSGTQSGTPASPAPRLTQAPAGQAPVAVEIREPDPTPLQVFFALVMPLLAPLAAAGIVLVFVVFMLLHKEDIRDRFIRLAGSRDMQRTTLLLDEGAEKLGHFLLLQTALNVAFGVLIAAGLWLIGIPNPVLWGLGVMILRFVPYIGVPLASIIPIVLALSVDPGWSKLAWTLALFFATELVVGQAIEPWIFGKKMGLSAVAIVISATFWTWLWGPLGLLLSTPLTMCLVVVGRHVDHLQFLEILLGDKPALAVEEALYLRMLGDDADAAAAEAEMFLKEYSLSRYYDDVALKALGLAQADVNRGELDGDRLARICETTHALIQNLSEISTGKSPDDHRLEQIALARSPAPTSLVLCVGGRGQLDEAAAQLLIHLLEERGIAVRLVSGSDVSATNVSKLDAAGISAVCLCYLDPGNLARARYLARRLQRTIPNVKIIAAFWGFTDNIADVSQAMGCEVVTGLQEALEKITDTIAGLDNSSVPRAVEGPPYAAPIEAKRLQSNILDRAS